MGYKHITSATTNGSLALPLTAYVTTANVPTNKMHVTLTSSSVFSLPSVCYMVADPGQDDKELQT